MDDLRDAVQHTLRQYLAASASAAIALAQVQKAWCTPLEELGDEPQAYRVRVLTRACLDDGRLVTVKLWFNQPTQVAADQWVRRLMPGSCWEVFGQLIDVGHLKYQTISVSDLQQPSANIAELFMLKLSGSPKFL